MRVDLFTTIHKGIRALLFDISTEAARVDVSACIAVDGLVERIHQLIAFLDEHAHHEDIHVLPAIAFASPDLARSLGIDHRALDEMQVQVGITADGLACADVEGRAAVAAQLSRTLNRLTAAHLDHMHREETEVNEVLWGALGDTELAEIRGRILAALAPERHLEWQALMVPALSPVERAAVIG